MQSRPWYLVISVEGLLAGSIVVLWNQLKHITHLASVSWYQSVNFWEWEEDVFVVAIDHFTRWVEAQVLHEKNSKIHNGIYNDNILFRNGFTARIQTERRSPYVSEAIQYFFWQWDIVQTMLAAYHPESNGMAEQTISDLKSNLVKIRMDDWLSAVRCLVMAVAAIRMVPSRTTGICHLNYFMDGKD